MALGHSVIIFILVTDTDCPLGCERLMSLQRRQLYPLSIDLLDNQNQIRSEISLFNFSNTVYVC